MALKGAKGRTSATGRVIDGRIFPGDEVLVTERLIQIAQTVLYTRNTLHVFKVRFINKPRAEPEAKFIIIRRGERPPGSAEARMCRNRRYTLGRWLHPPVGFAYGDGSLADSPGWQTPHRTPAAKG